MKHYFFIFTLLIYLFSIKFSFSQESVNVWTAIIHSTTQENTYIEPSLDKNITNVLKKNFKIFNSFKILSSKSANLVIDRLTYVKPINQFHFLIKYKGTSQIPSLNQGKLMEINLFQNKKKLLVSDSILSNKKPIIIGGPKFKNGQILFIIKLIN